LMNMVLYSFFYKYSQMIFIKKKTEKQKGIDVTKVFINIKMPLVMTVFFF